MIDDVEQLSEEIHHLYCAQYKADNGFDYWTLGDYSKLPEKIKGYDRVMARFFLRKSKEIRQEIHDSRAKIAELEFNLKDREETLKGVLEKYAVLEKKLEVAVKALTNIGHATCGCDMPCSARNNEGVEAKEALKEIQSLTPPDGGGK